MHSGSREFYQDTSMILQPNEHIVELTSFYDQVGVIGLKFVTNQGRELQAMGDAKPKNMKKATKIFGGPKNHVLCGLKTKFLDHLVSLS